MRFSSNADRIGPKTAPIFTAATTQPALSTFFRSSYCSIAIADQVKHIPEASSVRLTKRKEKQKIYIIFLDYSQITLIERLSGKMV